MKHARHGALLPPELARNHLGVIRPQDASEVYRHPRPELARLAERGMLHRAANGYYVVVPRADVGGSWLPELEPLAAGVAASIYGGDGAILMGVSAARVLGAVPRALATAIVAVPRQHRPITLTDRPAQIVFVRRNPDVLDAELVETSLGSTLATTPEQTVLDLAHRPSLGNAEVDVPAMISVLYRRCDVGRLTALAREQRLSSSLQRAKKWRPTHEPS